MAFDDRRLTLLVPGVLGPWEIPAEVLAEDLQVPALEALLSRGRGFAERWPDSTLEGMLFRTFGLDRPSSGDWPVAAVTRMLDGGLTDNRWYLRADPVHLQPDLSKLVLLDAGALSLGERDAAALVQEINAFYRDEGWTIEALRPRRWYVRSDDPVDLHTTSVWEAAGTDVSACLPEGPDQSAWHRRFNEIQMILHQSPVNEAREARGDLPVNSVWFWGGGFLPRPGEALWHKLWADHPLAQGLARLNQIPSARLPRDAEAWLAQAETGALHLAVLADGRERVRRGDVEGWRDWVRFLEAHWFRPLETALTERNLASVTLLTGCGRGFELRRSSWRDLWRRRRPLRSFLG